ncbi:two-component sensor histidine kinase [Streptomyces spiroverticillatus]|uniref:histidine kinase n=1 Tax=Streptomyces finlayi TaxID=67296 RepID=A0A919CDE8_9ACTN|nr:HAMP domain-containing sensor histidine kinase [Streptomyces finlayi]GHA32398.1 two-component sensor histidine kinase [Streptomyces spiroverticillatus]GHD10611.1 two-component sensor histidine kinase [Streptomyces finlayi]
MRSVRARAALGATAVVAVALVAAGLAVLLVLATKLTDQTDLRAEVAAQEVASQVALGTAYEKLELPDKEDNPVQVVTSEGQLVAVSKKLEAISGAGSPRVKPVAVGAVPAEDDDADDADDPGRGEVSRDEPRMSTGSATVDGDEGEYRFAAVEATRPDGRTVTVYAGAPLSGEREAVGTVRDAMLTGLPVLLVVVAGVTWLVTRRALRPVEGIRREMAAITASADLSRRVPAPGTGDEVDRLAVTTNETLAALEASVDRQRRFVADASHELRSPIASLRTQLEVGAAHPELLDLEGAVEDTVRLQDLAADLLLLARLDAGEKPGAARVDLSALVRREVAQRADRDRIPVAVEVADGVEVAGSRGQLGRILGNLLDNAQRHAAGSVTVTLRAEAGRAVLEVADDGAGVPEAERERIFERFVRLDDARSRDEGGAGLGLAIARDVAHRHGGTLTVGRAPGGGARFALVLELLRTDRSDAD